MIDVVIVAATRTAIGSFQGSLAEIPAPELGAIVIKRIPEKPFRWLVIGMTFVAVIRLFL